MTRWLGILLISALLTAAFGLSGMVTRVSDAVWLCVLFLVFVSGLARIGVWKTHLS